MIPLDLVSGGFDMVCNGRRVVILNEGLEVFSFSIMKSSFCFTDVEIIAVPATGLHLTSSSYYIALMNKIVCTNLCRTPLEHCSSLKPVYSWFLQWDKSFDILFHNKTEHFHNSFRTLW